MPHSKDLVWPGYNEGYRDGRKAETERKKSEQEVLHAQIKDLAMLVARLSRSLQRADPPSNLPRQATDYLQRKSLTGSPIRSDS